MIESAGRFPPSLTRTCALPRVLNFSCLRTVCSELARRPLTCCTKPPIAPPGFEFLAPPAKRTSSEVVSTLVCHERSEDFGTSRSPVDLRETEAGERRSANRVRTS